MIAPQTPAPPPPETHSILPPVIYYLYSLFSSTTKDFNPAKGIAILASPAKVETSNLVSIGMGAFTVNAVFILFDIIYVI